MSEKPRAHDLFYVYRILDHPLRRRIVEILGESGSAAFTELKKLMNVRVGTLYYHFDALKGFITQDAQRRYALTDLGREAYRLLSSREYEEITAKAKAQLSAQPAPYLPRYVRNLFVPSDFFRLLYAKPAAGAVGMALIIAFGAWVTTQTRLEPLLLFFMQSARPPWLLLWEFPSSWLAVFAVSEVLTLVLYGRRGDSLYLLIGAAYGLVPLLLLPTLRFMDLAYGLRLFLFRDPLLLRLLLTVLQAWTVSVLSAAIAQAKGLRLDRAVVVALFVAYGSLAASYVVGG